MKIETCCIFPAAFHGIHVCAALGCAILHFCSDEAVSHSTNQAPSSPLQHVAACVVIPSAAAADPFVVAGAASDFLLQLSDFSCHWH